ncbi:hypothetical protein ACFL9U_08040 [Thermodesulfobacteriota bacterium]
MTLVEIIETLSDYSLYIAVFFIAVPLIVLGYGTILKPDQKIRSPFKYIYSFFIYLSSIPGIFALIITVYALFFLRANLLAVNFIIYFLPIISMIVTLIFVSKSVDLNFIPGFDRLFGLFTLIGVTFIITLVLMKLRVWVLFGGSIVTMFILFGFLFLLLKWAAYTMFRSKSEKRLKPPGLPKI